MKKQISALGMFLWCANYSLASTYIACSEAEKVAGTCFDCGTSCVARYSESTNEDGSTKGTLTVSGTGDMSYYTYSYNDQLERYQTNAPWKNLDRNITNVIVEEGITSVDGFYNHTKLQSVSLPNSLIKIAMATFQSDSKLTDVNIPPNVTTIGHAAFSGTNVEYFTIPENYKRIEQGYTWSNTYLFGSTALKGITIVGNADFDKDMLLGANFSKIASIYCDTLNESCQALLDDEKIGSKIKFYEQSGSQYLYKGKFYSNPADIAVGNYDKKKIYTVEEAAKLSKPTGNSFKIRYR